MNEDSHTSEQVTKNTEYKYGCVQYKNEVDERLAEQGLKVVHVWVTRHFMWRCRRHVHRFSRPVHFSLGGFFFFQNQNVKSVKI